MELKYLTNSYSLPRRIKITCTVQSTMVRRRLLSIASATCIHGTQGCPSSSQHSFSASTKFPIALHPQPHLSQYISPHKLSKENYISSHQTAPYFHLVSRGNFSTLATAVNSAIKCWACGAEASDSPFLACSSCKSVQPLDYSVDFFHIFNLEPGYDVDAKDLEKKYKDWQKRLHPDLFQCKSEQEKEYSAQQSAQVIKAYNTLLKPLSRAEYMLRLQGIHVDEERTVTDSELLMEIMEVRESVEDADNDDALKSIQSKMRSKLEECQMAFATAYVKHDFESAVSALQKMSYYERVNAEIIKKL